MMKPSDVAKLLEIVGYWDPWFRPTDGMILAWTDILSAKAPTMGLDWAIERVRDHYSSSKKSLMPADLIDAWKRERERRIEGRMAPVPPIDPSDTRRYVEWTRAWYRAAGDGLDDGAAEVAADRELGVARSRASISARSVDYDQLGIGTPP
jgi:hypothetical protein